MVTCFHRDDIACSSPTGSSGSLGQLVSSAFPRRASASLPQKTSAPVSGPWSDDLRCPRGRSGSCTVLGNVTLALIMPLGDQPACCVQGRQLRIGGSSDTSRHAMAEKPVHRPFRHLSNPYKTAPLASGSDHMLVVDDLMPDIDRRAKFLQCAFDDLNGAHDAGAEAARLRQDDPPGASHDAGPRKGCAGGGTRGTLCE